MTTTFYDKNGEFLYKHSHNSRRAIYDEQCKVADNLVNNFKEFSKIVVEAKDGRVYTAVKK
jgi:hypothetical protein